LAERPVRALRFRGILGLWHFPILNFIAEMAGGILPEIAGAKYRVKYIDLTTGRTKEEVLSEREMWDFYRRQRRGEVSVIEIKKSE